MLANQPVLVPKQTGLWASRRWRAGRIQRSPIQPDLFISIAEECGLIERLGTLGKR